MTNGNDFINPSTHQNEDGTHDFSKNKGLTKREHFAAMAMQGMISKYGTDYQQQHARESVYMADELIKALNENKY